MYLFDFSIDNKSIFYSSSKDESEISGLGQISIYKNIDEEKILQLAKNYAILPNENPSSIIIDKYSLMLRQKTFMDHFNRF
jgi:hypothetical protein